MHVTKTEQLTDYPYLNVFRAEFEHEGHEGQWLYVRRKLDIPDDLPNAVAIVPMLDDRVVLIRQFRVPVGDYVLEFPAGLVDPGYGVAETAAKELKEETGLTLEEITHVSPPVYNSPGLSDETAVCVFARCSGTPSTRHSEEAEDIEILTLTADEAAELARRDDIKIDGKCWMLLHAAFAMHGQLL